MIRDVPTRREPRVVRWWSIPNLLTLLRLCGSPGLILLAAWNQLFLMGCWLAVLVLTEWLDGFLARRLHLESALGARLDSIADATFYVCLLVALVILRPDLLALEAGWIAAAIGSYLLSWLVSWIKFGCLPSYHTWAAKGVWLVVGGGTLALVLAEMVGPFRLAMGCVVLTNLEAVAISLALNAARVDVPTLWHARRIVAQGDPQLDGRETDAHGS